MRRFIRMLRNIKQVNGKNTNNTNNANPDAAGNANPKPEGNAPDGGFGSPLNNPVANVTQDTILQYLAQFFQDPDALLAGMAKANCILSGSRAVEVYFPGSCAPDSDFDFYVDSSARCVGEAIKVLHAAGVDFDRPFQSALDVAATTPLPGVPTIVQYHYKDKEQLRRIVALPDCPDAAASVLRQMLAYLDDRDEFGRIHVLDNGVYVHMVQGRPTGSYGYSPSVEIITGQTMTTNGRRPLKVQLVFAPHKSTLSHIFDFYATCVQAAITGFGAVHLYAGVGRRALYWPLNTQHQESAVQGMLKYGHRGYTFELAIGHKARVQQLNSDPLSRSKLVLFTHLPLSMSRKLYAARQDFFSTLTWMEHNGETILMSQPTKAMRDVLADERRQRVVRRANGLVDDSSVRLACQHSVFFKQPTDAEPGPAHRYPDEIVGL